MNILLILVTLAAAYTTYAFVDADRNPRSKFYSDIMLYPALDFFVFVARLFDGSGK